MMKKTHAERMKAHTRSIFARNLAALTDGKNISLLAEQIGINRTQFNKYRSGESTPSPEVLKRIYEHFGYDARLLDTRVRVLDLEKHIRDHKDRENAAFKSILTRILEGASDMTADEIQRRMKEVEYQPFRSDEA